MKILDAHLHLGEDCVFDHIQTEEQLDAGLAENKVDGGVVQPFLPRCYLQDTRQAHDRVAAYCKAGENRWGMMSMNPHFSPEDFEQEAQRCIRQLGFVGIKLTPIGHGCDPCSKDAMHLYETAQALGVPVMVHTGSGIPFADPSALFTVAERFPHLPLVVAHAGTDLFSQQAIYLARRFEQVFLEPSWVKVGILRKMIQTLGPEKIMFSSDLLNNLPIELLTFRMAAPNEQALEQMMWRTVSQVYRLG